MWERRALMGDNLFFVQLWSWINRKLPVNIRFLYELFQLSFYVSKYELTLPLRTAFKVSQIVFVSSELPKDNNSSVCLFFIVLLNCRRHHYSRSKSLFQLQKNKIWGQEIKWNGLIRLLLNTKRSVQMVIKLLHWKIIYLRLNVMCTWEKWESFGIWMQKSLGIATSKVLHKWF